MIVAREAIVLAVALVSRQQRMCISNALHGSNVGSCTERQGSSVEKDPNDAIESDLSGTRILYGAYWISPAR
jgi:hypothetical protein